MNPIRINLLPASPTSATRTVRRSIIAALSVGIFTSAAALVALEHLNARQQERNVLLQTALQRIGMHRPEAAETVRLKNELIRRAQSAAELDQKRFEALRLLDTLNRLMPSATVLTALSPDSHGYTLRGFAGNEMQIAELMRLLAAEPLFASAELHGITRTPDQAVPQFVFRIRPAAPVPEHPASETVQ